MPDDLRERIADLRRLRDAASPLPWVLFGDPGKWHIGGPFPESGDKSVGWDALQYAVAAANLAPALADAYDAALATIAERDAEIARLREALKPFADHWRHINESRELNNKHGWDWPYPVGDDEVTSVYVSTVRRAANTLKGANRDE